MATVGGSIESVSLAGRDFGVPADANVDRDLGGFQAESKANGNGTFRIVVTRKTSSLDGLQVEIDDNRSDQEFLQDLADRKTAFDVAITYASGAVYQGVMMIEGEIKAGSTESTATVSLKGGTLTKQ